MAHRVFFRGFSAVFVLAGKPALAFVACNTAFHLRGTGNAYRKGDQGEQATSRSAIASSTRLLRGFDASGILLPSRKRTGTTREAALLPERVGRPGVARRATGETRPGLFSLPLAAHEPRTTGMGGML